MGIQTKLKKLTKTFMMISNLKKTLVLHVVYRTISALGLNIISESDQSKCWVYLHVAREYYHHDGLHNDCSVNNHFQWL